MGKQHVHVHTYSKSSGDMYRPCISIFSGVASEGDLQNNNNKIDFKNRFPPTF